MRDALLMRRNMKCEWTCGQSRVSAKRASATSTRASGCNVWARGSACVKDSFMTMVMSKPGAKAWVCVDVEPDDPQVVFEMDETVVWSSWSGFVHDDGAVMARNLRKVVTLLIGLVRKSE